MAYKGQKKAAKNVAQEEQPKEKHKCSICTEDAVIIHNGEEYYCYDHYRLRLESISHKDTVEKVKRGEGCKSILDNYPMRE